MSRSDVPQGLHFGRFQGKADLETRSDLAASSCG
jgi:hypothetical protein